MSPLPQTMRLLVQPSTAHHHQGLQSLGAGWIHGGTSKSQPQPDAAVSPVGTATLSGSTLGATGLILEKDMSAGTPSLPLLSPVAHSAQRSESTYKGKAPAPTCQLCHSCRQHAGAPQAFGPLGSTCRYCNLTLRGAPIKHTTECSVLFLVHLLQAVHALHSPSSLPPEPAQVIHDHSFHVRADGEPGRHMEATKELQAIESQMQLIKSIPRPAPPTSTPGQSSTGPMDTSHGDDTQDLDGRPTKWPRDGSKAISLLGKGKGAHGRGAPQQGARNQGGRPSNQLQPPWHRSGQGQGYGPSSSHPDLHLMYHTMARLLMRREDALSVLQQSTTWVLFLTTQPPGTILPKLFATAQGWHELKHNNPDSITQPMRTILWQKLMTELKGRAQKVLDDKEAMDQAVQLNLYDPNSGFGYRRWNNKEGMMQPMEDREPLSAKKIIEIAQELATLSVQPQLLNRFHATRFRSR